MPVRRGRPARKPKCRPGTALSVTWAILRRLVVVFQDVPRDEALPFALVLGISYLSQEYFVVLNLSLLLLLHAEQYLSRFISSSSSFRCSSLSGSMSKIFDFGGKSPFHRTTTQGSDSSPQSPPEYGANDPHPERRHSASVSGLADTTHRGLKPRHIQLIGIGGTIGTALYVQIGRGLLNGGPASLFLAFTIWCAL